MQINTHSQIYLELNEMESDHDKELSENHYKKSQEADGLFNNKYSWTYHRHDSLNSDYNLCTI